MASWLRVVVGVMLAAATVSACQGGPAKPAKPPDLVVARLGPTASDGVIAKGTINGKPWQITLTLAPERSCDPQPGWAAHCLETVGDAVRHWLWQSWGPVDPVHIWTFIPALYGPVRSNVTRVSMRMSDGVVLELHPVEVFGHRWMGLVLPASVTPLEAIVYDGRKEIGHAVPYVGPGPGDTQLVDFTGWLPPGVKGPPERRQVLRGGGMRLVLHSGPWGNYLFNRGAGWDFPLGYRVDGALQGGGELPAPVPMGFPSPARYIELVYSNGTRRRVPLVLGVGMGFAIVRVTARPAVLRWDVYDVAGHRLTGGQGPPGGPY
jgi:hypothetical protein